MSTDQSSFLSMKNIGKDLIKNTQIDEFLENKTSVLLSRILESKSKPYVIKNAIKSVSIPYNNIINKENINKNYLTENFHYHIFNTNNRDTQIKIYQTKSDILYKRKVHLKNSIEKNLKQKNSSKNISTRTPVVIKFNNLTTSISTINTKNKNNDSIFDTSTSRVYSKEKNYSPLSTSSNVKHNLFDKEKNEIFRNFYDLKKKSEEIFRRKLRKNNNSHSNFKMVKQEIDSLSEIKRKIGEYSRSINNNKRNSNTINLFNDNNNEIVIKKNSKNHQCILRNDKAANLNFIYYDKNKTMSDITKNSYYENANKMQYNYFNGENNKHKNQQIKKQETNINDDNYPTKPKKNTKKIHIDFSKFASLSKTYFEDIYKKNVRHTKKSNGSMTYRDNKLEKLETFSKTRNILGCSRYSICTLKVSKTLPSILEEEEKMKLENENSKIYCSYLKNIEFFIAVFNKLKIKTVKGIFNILYKIKISKRNSKKKITVNRMTYVHKRIQSKSFNKNFKK